MRMHMERHLAGWQMRDSYDHRVNPGENINLAPRPEYAGLVESMEQRLDAGWRHARPPQ